MRKQREEIENDKNQSVDQEEKDLYGLSEEESLLSVHFATTDNPDLQE